MSSTRAWLPLESIRIPRVSGKLDSAAKYLMVCGLPSSAIAKLSLVRLGISAPFLSFTLKNNCTMLTLTFSVSTLWSSFWLVCDCGGAWLDCAPGTEYTGIFCANTAGATKIRHKPRPIASRSLQFPCVSWFPMRCMKSPADFVSLVFQGWMHKTYRLFRGVSTSSQAYLSKRAPKPDWKDKKGGSVVRSRKTHQNRPLRCPHLWHDCSVPATKARHSRRALGHAPSTISSDLNPGRRYSATS